VIGVVVEWLVVERRHVDRLVVVGHGVDRLVVVRQQLVRQHLERLVVVGQQLVGLVVVRQQLVRLLVERLVVRVEVRPALKMEDLLCSTVALATEGKTNRKGMPKPLHLALFVREYENEVRAPFPPPAVVRALMAPLAAIGRARGHGERYEAPAPARAFLPVPA
jgi:hypothetical protein